LTAFSFSYQRLAADRAEKIRARTLALAARSSLQSPPIRSTTKIAKPTSAELETQRFAVFFIHNGAPQALVGCSAFATAFPARSRSGESGTKAARRLAFQTAC
jgi:hypothetical protein